MRRIKLALSSLAGLVGAGLIQSTANAAVTIDIEERGADVIIAIDGSLDLTGLSSTLFSGSMVSAFVRPDLGTVGAISANPTLLLFLPRSTPPALIFGTGGAIGTLSFSGSTFRISQVMGADIVQLDASYTSGDPISAVIAFSGLSFTDLGIFSAFEGMRTLDNGDTITIRTRVVDAASVPLPAAAALFVPAALIGFVRRPRPRAA